MQIKFQLATDIHPNPGLRDKTFTGKKNRLKERYSKQRVKRLLKKTESLKIEKNEVLKLVTWNV